jgi:hypothetical protein
MKNQVHPNLKTSSKMNYKNQHNSPNSNSFFSQKKVKLIYSIALLFIGASLFYLYLPVINYGFIPVAFILLILLILSGFIFTSFEISLKTKQIINIKRPNKIFIICIILIACYITIIPLLTSHPIFRNQKYRNLIGSVKTKDKILSSIAPISIDEIRVVDEELAYLLGEKILGTQPSLGSQVELGDFCIQKVKNKLYWVAPLLHSGFFKWFYNTEGTNGYVMVSATNERDVQLIQHSDGKDIKIKYQQGAYFQSEIHRHVYLSGYVTSGLTDFSFEIDDKGKPYWIITKYTKKIGFSGDDANGVLVVDAKTGDIRSYSLKNIPYWIDRVHPISFIEEQLNNWGEYVHGYWNFSNSNKLKITEGLTLVYGKNNKSYWYTGLTSVGKEESAVGFVLVDTRTKETTFYQQGGATEFAAQSSAEGKVQEKGYNASLPIPYNINNIPTYVMTLKDEGGLVKMYAMVAISDYTIVGVGNTLRETLSSFKNSFNMADNKLTTTQTESSNCISSIVTRIQNDVKNGNSFYYFKVKDYPKIFVGSSQLSPEIPVTIPGDSIKISFDIDGEEIIDVIKFENLDLYRKIKK